MKNILSIQSHVVFGHAGNAAAVFPMQRMGMNVWPLNTVQFSNHTQYPEKWTGVTMPAAHLGDIATGLNNIGVLAKCDAVLSGYIGAADQGEHILNIVKEVKAQNPNALYACDPVMGHSEKGCVVAPGVAEFICQQLLPHSDIISPNLLELETLTLRPIGSVHEAVEAARLLCTMGTNMVLIKHLNRAAFHEDCYETMLVTKDQAWHISRPLVNFSGKQPVGVGDLTSGLFLSCILAGKRPVEALEHVTAAVYDVVYETQQRGEYELQLIAAQDAFVQPKHHFKAINL
ncbi:pyridoxal kinase PdxY [Neisseriaceae bacterium CLB008]